MHFSINFQGNKSPLITILDIFSGDPACYPGQMLSLVKVAETALDQIYYLYRIFLQGGASAILFVSLGVTTPIITLVTFSQWA